ncbi:GNAT family N-acetyltransferase [Rhizobium sp. RAF36]|uniref:GNAT family N-acetyltransferase n=1 Tax=Rhizobium sp. RAF36 TaxID=3233055 RepID=UPI003F96C2FB
MTEEIRNNTTIGRFELPIKDDALAAAYYRDEDGILVLVHTEVPFEYVGQGFATRLAEGMFSVFRTNDQKVRPRCEFMARYVLQHPELDDLVRW